MKMNGMAIALCTCVCVAGAARADVIQNTPAGFVVHAQALVHAPAARVYDALVQDVGLWWDPAHTWSGDSVNLSLDARPGGCRALSLFRTGRG